MMPGYWQRNHASRSYYHLGNTLMQKATKAIPANHQKTMKNRMIMGSSIQKKRRIRLNMMDQEEACNVSRTCSYSLGDNRTYAGLRSVWYYEDAHGSIGQLKRIVKKIRSNTMKLRYAQVCFDACSFECEAACFASQQLKNQEITATSWNQTRICATHTNL